MKIRQLIARLALLDQEREVHLRRDGSDPGAGYYMPVLYVLELDDYVILDTKVPPVMLSTESFRETTDQGPHLNEHSSDQDED